MSSLYKFKYIFSILNIFLFLVDVCNNREMLEKTTVNRTTYSQPPGVDSQNITNN